MASGKQDKNGVQVLRYLDDHKLDHTPDHYLFAHRVLFGRDQAFRDTVSRHTDGGVRISPEQVRKLSPQPPGAGQAIKDFAPGLDALTLRVLDIAGDAASATGNLNRDLVTAIKAMLDTQGADVRPIVTTMIDQTAGAETRLREAVRQARQLHDDLNALYDDATRDRVTGLLSRRAMEDRLATAAARSVAFSVAIIDVDRFRAVNHDYGHAVGDRVLRAVAETLRESCSAFPIGRWGGGEFIVLMEDMSAADAGELIEAARAKLTERRMKLRENDKPLDVVSFSASVVASRSRDPAAIIEAAMTLMREAKDRGRNTVGIEKAVIDL